MLAFMPDVLAFTSPDAFAFVPDAFAFAPDAFAFAPDAFAFVPATGQLWPGPVSNMQRSRAY